MLQYAHPFPDPHGFDAGDGFGATAGRVRPHRGVDYIKPSNTPIRCIAAGVVVVNQWSADLGNVLGIRFDDGMYGGLAHLIRKPARTIGERLAFLQPGIANVGTTGLASRGNHLHLSLGSTEGAIFGEGYGTTLVDPYKYIQARLTVAAKTGVEDMDYSYIYKAASGTTPVTYGLVSPNLLPGGSKVTTDVKVAEGWSAITRQAATLLTTAKFKQAIDEAALLAAAIPTPPIGVVNVAIDNDALAKAIFDEQMNRPQGGARLNS